MPRQSIIARGPYCPSSAEYKRRFHELHLQLKAKYADEIARASFLKRISIWFRIQHEILRQIERPPRSPHALYQCDPRTRRSAAAQEKPPAPRFP